MSCLEEQAHEAKRIGILTNTAWDGDITVYRCAKCGLIACPDFAWDGAIVRGTHIFKDGDQIFEIDKTPDWAKAIIREALDS